MKIKILLLALLCLASSSIFASGWQNDGVYKYINMQGRSVSQIVSKQIEGKFLVVCGDSVFYVDMASGEIDSVKMMENADPSHYFENLHCIVSSDGLSYCTFYGLLVGSGYNSSIDLYARTIDFNTNAKIFDTKLSNIYFGGAYESSAYFKAAGFDYNNATHKGFVFSNFYTSLRIHTAMAFTFFTLWLGFLLLTIGHFTDPVWNTIAAYDLFVCAGSAWYMMFAIIINDLAGKTVLPMGKQIIKSK